MELKKHTPEEFEQMSDEEFEDYEARLFEIANDIFLKRYTIEELEVSLLRIKELAKNKKKRCGHRYWQCSKEEKACLGNIHSAAEKFKKTIIEEITKFIDEGMLVFTRAFKCEVYGEAYLIKYMYKERYYDLYDECEYTEVISCAKDPGAEVSVEINKLPVDVLMKIYHKIVDGDAVLLSDEEVIADNIDSEDIKL